MTPQEVENQWQRLHREFALALMANAGAREGAALDEPATRIDERLVQAVWCDQMLRSDDMVTASGKRLEVIEPGRWNTSRGPDFLDARLRLAGEIVEGDVEIHVQAADWTRHRHHQDFEYNRVVLHVALRPGDDRPYDEKQNGGRLERLYIEDILEPDLETIRNTINFGDYPHGRPQHLGLCHEQFLRMPGTQLAEFLHIAGRSRMEQKIARFQAQRSTAPYHQVLYQALMTGQGFKSSKTLYFLLSKRAPVSELVDHARDVPPAQRVDFYLSTLLHVARLVPEQQQLEGIEDPEAQAFLDSLSQLWKPVRPYFSDRMLPPTKRWMAGMRPAGFPTRRLTAVAMILGRLTDKGNPLLDRLRFLIDSNTPRTLSAKDLRGFYNKMTELLLVEEEAHYFSTHFTFGGKKGRPQALLGEPAARSVLFNVFLPLMILQAREKGDAPFEAKCWEVVFHFPALEKNSIIKFMEKRLFGESKVAVGFLKTEIFQQALLKIFSDCCAQNERTCSDCTFYALAEKMENAAS